MTVVSFRVPKELKKKMKGVNANWSKRVRHYLEVEVNRHRRNKILDEIEASMKDVPEIKAGTAAKLIREDRDSH